jgi:pyruvate/2-oxoglutarate dehydrogenase complex dihydrolipoamide acyltransferase (E2) component
MCKRPIMDGDAIVAHEVMLHSVRIEHCLVDGAEGARSTMRVKTLLKDPSLILL